MKKQIIVAALALVLSSPYLMIYAAAKSQYSGDYKYIFPNYSDTNSVGEPKSVCTTDIFDLDYLGFVWGGLNNLLNIVRPDTIPIHAAVLSGTNLSIFSFKKMRFVPVIEGTQVYGEALSCSPVQPS